ncbi:MAG: MoaD/ThiS family protein [Bacillota bacterium]
MKVRVRLWGGLNVYHPDRLGDCEMVLESGATVDSLLERIKVPVGMAAIVIVNGVKAELDRELKDNDFVEVYPPICGG